MSTLRCGQDMTVGCSLRDFLVLSTIQELARVVQLTVVGWLNQTRILQMRDCFRHCELDTAATASAYVPPHREVQLYEVLMRANWFMLSALASGERRRRPS